MIEVEGKRRAPTWSASGTTLSGVSGGVVKSESRIVALSTIEGGYWNHFAQGDRVLVFDELDPANGIRRVRRGTVHDPPSLDIIRIDFGGEGHREISSADPVQITHVAGTCHCVVAIS
jgi:hypothetical protein